MGGPTIDYDEIESLLRGIDYISKVTSSTKLSESEYEGAYKAKKGVFSIYYDRFQYKTYGRWKIKVCGVEIEDLSQFQTLIFQAKQKLDKIK